MEKTVPSRILTADHPRIEKIAKRLAKRGGSWRPAEVIHEGLNALERELKTEAK